MIVFCQHSVVIAFLLNELISITKNIGLMDVPIPKTLIKAIDVLKEKNEHI